LAAPPARAQTNAPPPAAPGSAPPASRYGDPAWWAQRKEEILEPALEIVDPHHHLWDRKEHRYRSTSCSPTPAAPVRTFTAAVVRFSRNSLTSVPKPDE